MFSTLSTSNPSPIARRLKERTHRILWVYVLAALALYLWAMGALKRAREDAAADLERADSGELDNVLNQIAAQRGVCACAEGSESCGARGCLVCHRCGKAARLLASSVMVGPSAGPLWNPDSPGYRAARRAAFSDAVAAGRPYNAPPAPIGDLPPGAPA